MESKRFTDYNILAREDGSTTYKVVGMQRIFQHIRHSKVFEQRFESLDHVVNAIMETVEDDKVPKVHSTLLAYAKMVEKPDSAGKGLTDMKAVRKEIVEHLPESLRSFVDDRLPGSNVTTVEENGTLIGYREIDNEFAYLVFVLNQALAARKRGEAFDAVQQRFMREAGPPISY